MELIPDEILVQIFCTLRDPYYPLQLVSRRFFGSWCESMKIKYGIKLSTNDFKYTRGGAVARALNKYLRGATGSDKFYDELYKRVIEPEDYTELVKCLVLCRNMFPIADSELCIVAFRYGLGGPLVMPNPELLSDDYYHRCVLAAMKNHQSDILLAVKHESKQPPRNIIEITRAAVTNKKIFDWATTKYDIAGGGFGISSDKFMTILAAFGCEELISSHFKVINNLCKIGLFLSLIAAVDNLPKLKKWSRWSRNNLKLRGGRKIEIYKNCLSACQSHDSINCMKWLLGPNTLLTAWDMIGFRGSMSVDPFDPLLSEKLRHYYNNDRGNLSRVVPSDYLGLAYMNEMIAKAKSRKMRKMLINRNSSMVHFNKVLY